MRISCGPANVLEGQRPGASNSPNGRSLGSSFTWSTSTLHCPRSASRELRRDDGTGPYSMCKVFADYETLPFSVFRACSEYTSSMLYSLTTSKPCSYEVLAAPERAGALSQSFLERRQDQTLRGRLEDRDRWHSARVVACRGQSLERSAPAHREKERVFGYRGWAPVLR